MRKDLQIIYRLTSELRTYENNARQHSKAQLKKLKQSLKAFGWTNPIIIDEKGMVLCGHGRLAAAVEASYDMVPTIQLSHMTDAQKRAYIIADNRIAEQANWSKAMLRSELKGLVEIGYEVELTGFDTIEIDTILSFDDPEPPVDDDVHLPDDIYQPVTRLGDIWQIGKHRLAVGDARLAEVLEDLMAGERAQLILTDPPFGCAVSGNVSGLGKVKHQDFVMGAGETSLPEFAATILRPAFKLMARHAQAGAIAFVFTDWRAAPHLLDAASGIFHEHKNLIVWAKTNAGMGTFYRSAHELIYAFKVSPGTHINTFGLGEGGRHRSNVWTYPGANAFRAGRMEDLADHPTVKPKQMIADAILDCSTRGGIVLDPFCGSGTTLVAAEMTGRRGYGVELDPKYADVILRRVSEAAGVDPMLDGVPFSEVAKLRAAEDEEVAHG